MQSVGTVGTEGTVGTVSTVGTVDTVGTVGNVGTVGTLGTVGTVDIEVLQVLQVLQNIYCRIDTVNIVQGDVAVLFVSAKRDEFNLGLRLPGDQVHSGVRLAKRVGYKFVN